MALSIRTSTQRMNQAMENGGTGSVLVVPDEPVRPAGHKKLSDFIKTEISSNDTAHIVEQVLLETSSEIIPCFLKNNQSGTAISELEATAANFAKVVAPFHVPSTFAVYDDNKYIGVASYENAGFKTLTQDKLSPGDIDTSFLEKKAISIGVMENLDDELQVLEGQVLSLKRQINKLKTNANNCVVVEEFVIVSEKKTEIINLQEELKKEQEKINLKIAELKLTTDEVKRYRIVKGLAIGLTTSYIFIEDDLHRNNISKDGKRVDFDMTLYPILYHFKDKSYFEQWVGLRRPDESTNLVTVHDIVNFPDIKDWKPHYWPTLPPSKMAPPALKSAFNFAANDYIESENELFKKLKNNPVFIQHKNATFARYVLTSADIYRQVALKHIHDEYQFEGKSLHDQLVDQQNLRIKKFRKALILIEDFGSFFEENHKEIATKLLEDLHKEGIDYAVQTDKDIKVKNDGKADAEKIQKESKKLLDEIKAHRAKIRKAAVAKSKFDLVKENVIKAMNDYSNPGFWKLGGILRNHKNLALDITLFCNQQQPDPNDNVANIEAIRSIQGYINEHIKGSAMSDVLNSLLIMISKQLEGLSPVLPTLKPVENLTAFVLV